MRPQATFNKLGDTMARRGAGKRSSRVYEKDYFAFDGGLNTEDSPLSVMPGDLIGSKNYEPAKRGGYRRADGFEAFDGRPSPADQSFVFIVFGSGVPVNYPVADGTVTVNGQTSGATGILITLGQGSPYTDGFDPGFGPDDDIGFIALVAVTGTFVAGENLRVASTVFAAEVGPPVLNDAFTDDIYEMIVEDMEDYYRALITTVPGSGRVRGVWFFKGVVYAFRDNVGATACIMHKSTGAGWVVVPHNPRVGFDAGVGEIFEGNTVTGLTSGASGVVRRVGTTGGAWSGTKTGVLTFASITGGPFQDNEALQVGGVTKATANGASATPVLLPGGRYEFRTNNFYGHSSKYRMYGVDGVNKAFEYDPTDTCFAQISTGMTTDTPNHIGVYLDILTLAFPGGSLQVAARNLPLAWEVVLGAGELALGEEIVGIIEEIGASDNVALFIMGRNRINRLTGATPDDYKLVEFGIRSGAREWSCQRMSNGMYLDDQGFTTLTATDAHGNFRESIISDKARTLINKALARSEVSDSHISRELSLYRCSFADGTNIVIGYKDVTGRGGAITKDYRVTVTDYGMPLRCSCEEEGNDGRIRTFFGSDDGFIYEIRSEVRGFNGLDVECFARLPYHFSKSPQRFKRYRRGTIDVKTDSRRVSLKAIIDYSSGNPDFNSQPVIDMPVAGGGGFWDISEWMEFQWSSQVNPTATFVLDGSGTNISVGIYSKTAVELPHTLHGLTLHYSPRKLNRTSLA